MEVREDALRRREASAWAVDAATAAAPERHSIAAADTASVGADKSAIATREADSYLLAKLSVFEVFYQLQNGPERRRSQWAAALPMALLAVQLCALTLPSSFLNEHTIEQIASGVSIVNADFSSFSWQNGVQGAMFIIAASVPCIIAVLVTVLWYAIDTPAKVLVAAANGDSKRAASYPGLVKVHKRVGSVTLHALRTLVELSASVLFAPVMTSLCAGLKCNGETSNVGNFPCWSGSHVALSIAAVVLIAAMAVIACLGAMLLFPRAMDSTQTGFDSSRTVMGRSDAHPLRRPHWRSHLLLLAVMGVLVALKSVELSHSSLWVPALVAFLGMAVLVREVYMHLPFVSFEANQRAIVVLAAALWCAGMSTMAAFRRLPTADDPVADREVVLTVEWTGAFGIVPFALVAALAIDQRWRSIDDWIDLSSPLQVELRVRRLLWTAAHAERRRAAGVLTPGLLMAQIQGAVAALTTACTREPGRDRTESAWTQPAAAPPVGGRGSTFSRPVAAASSMASKGRSLRMRRRASNARTRVSAGAAAPAVSTSKKALPTVLELALDEAEELYADSLEVFDRSPMAHIFCARFSIAHRNNKQVGQSHYRVVMARSDSGLGHLFEAYQQQRRQLDDNLAASSSRGTLSITARVGFERHRQDARDHEMVARNGIVDFWTELLSSRPSGERLSRLSGVIRVAMAKSESSFKALLRLNPRSVTALRQYGQFLIQVANDNKRGLQVITEADSIEQDAVEAKARQEDTPFVLMAPSPEELDTTAEDVGVVIASSNPSTLGDITDVNATAVAMWGYSKREMVAGNLRMLMPEPFNGMHDMLMRRYVKSGKSDVMDVPRMAVMLHKQGYLIPSALMIRNMGEEGFGGVIRPIRIKENIIVCCAPSGLVTGCCRRSLAALGIKAERVRKGSVNILKHLPHLSAIVQHLLNEPETFNPPPPGVAPHRSAVGLAVAGEQSKPGRLMGMTSFGDDDSVGSFDAQHEDGRHPFDLGPTDTSVLCKLEKVSPSFLSRLLGSNPGAAGHANIGGRTLDVVVEVQMTKYVAPQSMAAPGRATLIKWWELSYTDGNTVSNDDGSVGFAPRHSPPVAAAHHATALQDRGQPYTQRSDGHGSRAEEGGDSGPVSARSALRIPGTRRGSTGQVSFSRGPSPNDLGADGMLVDGKRGEALLPGVAEASQERAAAPTEEEEAGSGQHRRAPTAEPVSKEPDAAASSPSPTDSTSSLDHAGPVVRSRAAGAETRPAAVEPLRAPAGDTIDSAEAAHGSQGDGAEQEPAGLLLAAAAEPRGLRQSPGFGSAVLRASLRRLREEDLQDRGGDASGRGGSGVQGPASVASSRSARSSAQMLRRILHQDGRRRLEPSLRLLRNAFLSIVFLSVVLNVVSIAFAQTQLHLVGSHLDNVSRSGQRQTLAMRVLSLTKTLQLMALTGSGDAADWSVVASQLEATVGDFERLHRDLYLEAEEDRFEQTVALYSGSAQAVAVYKLGTGLEADDSASASQAAFQVPADFALDLLDHPGTKYVPPMLANATGPPELTGLLDAGVVFAYKARAAARMPRLLWQQRAGGLLDDDVWFVLANAPTTLKEAFAIATEVQAENVMSLTASKSRSQLLMLVAQLALVTLALGVIAAPIILRIAKEKNRLFHLFADVPRLVLKHLRAGALNQLSRLQLEKEAEETGDADDLAELADRLALEGIAHEGIDWGAITFRDQTRKQARGAAGGVGRAFACCGCRKGASAPGRGYSVGARQPKRSHYVPSKREFVRATLALTLPVVLFAAYSIGKYLWDDATARMIEGGNRGVLFSELRGMTAAYLGLLTLQGVTTDDAAEARHLGQVVSGEASFLLEVADAVAFGSDALGVPGSLRNNPPQSNLFLHNGCLSNYDVFPIASQALADTAATGTALDMTPFMLVAGGAVSARQLQTQDSGSDETASSDSTRHVPYDPANGGDPAAPAVPGLFGHGRITRAACRGFRDGLLRAGLQAGLQEFTRLSKALVAARQRQLAEAEASAAATDLTLGGPGTGQQALRTRLSSLDVQAYHILDFVLLHNGLDVATTRHSSDLQESLSRTEAWGLAGTILSTLLLLVAYPVLIRPTVNRLDDSVKHTFAMMLLLPDPVVQGVPSVHQMIADFAAGHAKQGMRVFDPSEHDEDATARS